MKAVLLSSVAAAFLLTACDNNANDRNNTNTTNGATTPRQTSTHDVAKPVAPDNTAKNERDSRATNPTPLDQGNNSKDIDITAEIRRAVVDDDTYSTNAKNCKIITENGVVTLRGVVDSQAEKDSIEAKAKAVAGVSRVDNQLEVNTP